MSACSAGAGRRLGYNFRTASALLHGDAHTFIPRGFLMTTPSSGRLGALTSPARLRKILAWSVGTVAAFGVLGFFAAPPLVKSLIEQKAGEALHRKVSLGGLDINPYALSAELTGLSVRGESGDEVAGFDRLYVNLEAASLLRGGPVIRELQIDGPRLP
ncbi:MAG: hypothetical protein IPJ99_01130 [Betaproteobacteria bacterium]|nr:hypothetical protein [Betaproteobacteria bacterium]